MPRFGLISQLAQTRILLPLVHVEVGFRITGEFAAVEFDQVFEQTARDSLDIVYTFPLPGEAAVYRCEMQVNDRLIRAQVMESNAAHRTMVEKKAAGHRTALAEMDRENLFTLHLGNAAPGDRIVIRFAYFEKLDRLGSSNLSLRIPLSPGQRYIPGKALLRKNRGLGHQDDTDQVPDASRLSPPRVEREHPDVATLYLHGTLDSDEVEWRSVSSPSHPARVHASDVHVEVELAGEEHVPDRDFYLRWQEIPPPAETKPKAWTSLCEATADGPAQRHSMLQIRAPQPELLPGAVSYRQDIYFLLDRSGSMDGGKWLKCAEALHAFVRQLGSDDRVWITCFESDFQDFSDSPMGCDELLADPGFENLADLGTGGGTELLPALEHVLEQRRRYSADRPARLILITDGQVGNEGEVLRLMRQPQQQGLPMHCFGIDTAVNDAFLKNLARVTGGRCALMTPEDDIPAAVEKLAETLRRPVLTGLQLEGGVLPFESEVLHDLCAGEVMLVPLQSTAGLAPVAQISAALPDGSSHCIRFDLSDAVADEQNPIPRLLWAQRRIQHLLENNRQSEAVALAVRQNLACRGASLVAWDDAEKVPVASREVYQPSLAHTVSAARTARSQGSASWSQSVSCLAADDDDMSAPLASSPSFLGSITTSFSYFGRDLSSSVLREEIIPDRQDLPRPLGKLYDQLSTRYRSQHRNVAPTRQPLVSWLPSFISLLMRRAGLQDCVAHLLASILCHWAEEIISIRRQQHLELWLRDLATAPDFVSSFSAVLRDAGPHEALDDVARLMKTAQANPPGRKRGWFWK